MDNLREFTKEENIVKISKEIYAIHKTITECKSETELNNYHRALAFLMQTLREKEYSLLKWKKSPNVTKLAKQFGLIKNFSFIDNNFLDHVSKETRTYDNTGKHEALVSEPYNVDMQDCIEMIKICQENGLTFSIDGQSLHFPNNTFRISFNRKDMPEKAVQHLKKMFQEN